MTDEDIAKLKSDLKEVFSFIRCAGDKKKLKELIENNEGFHRMKRSTAEVIKAVTNTEIELPERETKNPRNSEQRIAQTKLR